ncbi:hypothetical protein [Cysteiniphilum sp. JM-1]|uniref:hypothetical protein n=1 Tax=Cysteiniphilum sp. JM-1 TaxID=2610891 RepID=UPI0012487962|nr:hypothetical protein [Cysteiniphilum sp. JM-1]
MQKNIENNHALLARLTAQRQMLAAKLNAKKEIMAQIMTIQAEIAAIEQEYSSICGIETLKSSYF